MRRATNKQEILNRAKRLENAFWGRLEARNKTDKQDNPIDENGKVITEKINSIEELTDADFTTPSRSVELPTLSKKVDNAIGANGKPVIIKKSIFEKNAKNHKFTPEKSREILSNALYNTDIVGQTQPNSKPFYWVAIKKDDKSPITILEVNKNKDNIEVISWFNVDNRNLERMKRQAESEGGELLILNSKSKVDSLSTPTNDLSSESKDTEKTRDEEVRKLNLGDISQSQAKSNSDKDIDFQKSEDYSSLSDRELKDEIERIYNILLNDTVELKGFLAKTKAWLDHPLYSVWKELTDLKTERYQEKKKKQEEYEKNNSRVVYTPKREALKISAYSGERVVYHGTKENIANKIVREGIKFGSELSDTDWRGGGYDVTNQESFSTSLNPNISKYYSGEHKVGIVKLEINPNANVVTVENEIYAEDLQDYPKELEGVDAVYLKNSGEEELVILNKDAVKIVEAKSFKVSDNVVRFHKSKSTPYKKGKISQQAFDQLIAKLKKPFAKAFKNINILTDWEAFERKAEEYRKKKNGEVDYQNVNEEFNRRLDEIEQGKLGKPLSLGKPNAILRSAGISDREMKFYGSKIVAKLKKHGYNAKDLSDLPNAVQNPIGVFKGSIEDSFAILTELNIKGRNVLAVISKGRGNDIDFNIVSSAYRKDGKGIVDWINKDKATYLDKEKSLNYLRTSAPIADSTSNSETFSVTNIEKEIENAKEKIKNFQNPKIENDLEYKIGVKSETSENLYENFKPLEEPIYTGETKEDEDLGTLREVLKPRYISSWFYADNTDPDIEEFDSLRDAVQDVFEEGDMSDNTSDIPYKQVRVVFDRVWVDENNDEIEEEDYGLDYYEVEDSLPEAVQNLPFADYGELHTETFLSNYERERQAEDSHSLDMEDVVDRVKNAFNGRSDFDYEKAGFGGRSHYINYKTENGTRVLIRIANHNFNIDNLNRNFTNKNYPHRVISIVIQNRLNHNEVKRFESARSLMNRERFPSDATVEQYIYDIEDIERIGGVDDFADYLIENIENFENGFFFSDEYGVEYMRTPSGVIYGAKLPDGTIYINPEHLNANTPIHEFAHLWEQLMPEKFAEGVKLFQNTPIGNKTFAQLRKNKGYKNYSDEKLWSEALVTYIGDKGEQLYHSSRKDKFIEWVKSFFKEIGAKLYSLSGGKLGKDFSPSDHLSKFTNNVLSDLLSGKELQGEPKRTISESFKGLTDSQLRNLLLNMGLAKPARC